ncbi:MAG: hypothetical protein D6698_14325 [Gammaproteobacteria bacterium]|nr:MAG: hypothetical protein D6698_14325 [Gammaproteobacteria bacterium]
MSIYERQYKELLTRELLKSLLEGNLPNLDRLKSRVEEILSRIGRPLYRYTPQFRRQVFNHKLFNDQLDDIAFDIRICHDEIMDMVVSLIRRAKFSELFFDAHTHILNRLRSQLEALLFITEGGDFYFLGAFDDFRDTSKTDLSESTQDIVNVSSSALMLPLSGTGTKRVTPTKITSTWPVEVEAGAASILRKSQVAGTDFRKIFTDESNGWAYEVVTDVPDDNVSVKFVFALDQETEISQISLVPLSPGPQKVKIRISVDNVNYKTLEGYEAPIQLEDRVETALVFPKELVEFVEVTLIKNNFDEQPVKGENIYRFGLKRLSLMTTGRAKKARYQSRPFSFGGKEEQISRIALRTDMERPKGTSVEFSVALADSNNKIVSSFIPIKPVNDDGLPGSQEVITFGTDEPHDLVIEGRPNEFVVRDTYRGHTFYKYSRQISPTPIFGTAELFRGSRVWSRDKSLAVTRTQIRDNHVSFAKSDIERMYATTTEVPVFRPTKTAGKPSIELTTRRDIYYVRGIHNLIPNYNQKSSNATPDYAVYGVEHISAKPTKTDVVATNGQTKVLLPRNNFVLTGPNAPIVSSSSGSIVYKAGRDYVFETQTVGGFTKPTGNLLIVPTSQGGTIYQSQAKPSLQITTTIDPDVTYKVTSIQGNKVLLTDMDIENGDTFQITYRYVPLPPSQIEKASVRVKSNIGPNAKFFVEGVDYAIDVSTGTIQRLPSGSIPEKGSVFVDFLFRDTTEDLETFLTWVRLDKPTQVSFELDSRTRKNSLSADTGERFLVNTKSGLVDLTSADRTPILDPGWVQFVVRSKNPDSNKRADNKGNLIDQVIMMRDLDGIRIFKAGGKYFQEILAFRSPMKQITLNHLRANTLPSNHSVFAIDPDGFLVINFNPGNTDELYLYIPRDEGSSDPTPEQYYENFRLMWRSKVTSNIQGSRVVVRCDLSRDPQFDGGLTPIVHSYTLRAQR